MKRTNEAPHYAVFSTFTTPPPPVQIFS